MFGRGVAAPMPVVLFSAPGGMASRGKVGLFAGATLLAPGYRRFMGQVAAGPSAETPVQRNDASAAS